MQTRTIAVQTHGRYLVTPSADAVGWLVGFHGYAHNAEIMLDELRKIPVASRWTLVSIQGLHRFYNRDNQVVASWMTRQDRELAIADNVAYVNATLEAVALDVDEPRRLVFAGFSQGVAMAYRAAAHARRKADGVIALGGDVPPELAASGASLPRVLIGRGTRDKWYNAEKMAADLRTLGGIAVSTGHVVFEAGHEWGEPFLEAAATFLSEIEIGHR